MADWSFDANHVAVFHCDLISEKEKGSALKRRKILVEQRQISVICCCRLNVISLYNEWWYRSWSRAGLYLYRKQTSFLLSRRNCVDRRSYLGKKLCNNISFSLHKTPINFCGGLCFEVGFPRTDWSSESKNTSSVATSASCARWPILSYCYEINSLSWILIVSIV